LSKSFIYISVSEKELEFIGKYLLSERKVFLEFTVSKTILKHALNVAKVEDFDMDSIVNLVDALERELEKTPEFDLELD
jgi:hypothetical protein